MDTLLCVAGNKKIESRSVNDNKTVMMGLVIITPTLTCLLGVVVVVGKKRTTNITSIKGKVRLID